MTILNKVPFQVIDTSEADKQEGIENILKVEAETLLKAKTYKKQQHQQMSDMRDTQYYCVVVFGNKNDKEEFIEKIQNEVEIEGKTFIDGYELASLMGLDVNCSAKVPKPHYVKQIKIKDGNSIRRRS